MKNKIYIETSVISYYVAVRSENIRVLAHQISTSEMWEQLSEYDVYISDIVVDEASEGSHNQSEARLIALKNFKILKRNEKVLKLTEMLLSGNAIPEKYPEDAMHIAIAAVYEIDYIVTWNFKHINNPFMKKKIRKIIGLAGYSCPVLCSPEELIGEEENV